MKYTKEQLNAMLEVRWHCSDLNDEVSIREYLYELLNKLWEEDEGFSGKRPFGNSGWYLEFAGPLIKGGFLKGTVTEDDGYIEAGNYNRSEYFSLVSDLIQCAVLGTAPEC